MLGLEHLRIVRRKNAPLAIAPLCGQQESDARALLDDAVAIARSCHDASQQELRDALDDLVTGTPPALARAARAACRLVFDRLAIEARDDVDAPLVRRTLFALAAKQHRSATFVRDDVLRAGAGFLAMDPADVDEALFADLQAAWRVDARALPDGAALLDAWRVAEVQALLLRARQLDVDVAASPPALRALLRAMKLHQLLFDVGAHDGSAADNRASLTLAIEGPMTMFSGATRYGLKLALLAPHVLAMRRYRLSARVQVRRGVDPELFVVAGGHTSSGQQAVDTVDTVVDIMDAARDAMPPIVASLLHDINARGMGFVASPATTLVAVPGAGAFAPDLVLTRDDGAQAFVELLGFWSRDAVWRRVEASARGLATPTVFCISERLRVSEEAIDSGSSGALVVFKGSLPARRVVEAAARLLAERAESTERTVPRA